MDIYVITNNLWSTNFFPSVSYDESFNCACTLAGNIPPTHIYGYLIQ